MLPAFFIMRDNHCYRRYTEICLHWIETEKNLVTHKGLGRRLASKFKMVEDNADLEIDYRLLEDPEMAKQAQMVGYSSEFTPHFLRLLKKLDGQIRERILAALELNTQT